MLEYRDVIGVDEVGRGPLLGPVVACASYISDYNHEIFEMIKDSKKLSESKREYIYDIITNMPSVKFAIGIASEKEIDEINILNATFLAMNRAIDKLAVEDKLILVDGNKKIKNCEKPQETLVKGDLINLNIALSSIIAKVYRDKLMYELDEKYPMYLIKNHKGYPTKAHYEAIKKYGLLDCHRLSFLKKAR